ncbi:carbamoyl-phosphate synthase large subunit [Calditerricola yamamurae]
MPKDPTINKVLVIGSGPIVIGQAAEFDYAGTQACLALKEEGVEVVLVNNNPATIMTDDEMADRIYLEPLTVERVAAIIARERPDGLLPTLGGQTGLNLAVKLAEAGVLERYGVRLLGTPLETIQRGEDREKFKALMEELGEPVPESTVAETVEEALAFAAVIGYPVIVRPAYTLGGSGGGIAADEDELKQVAKRGLEASPIGQILVEKSVKGWKEIEYEVMRDAADTCIIVCNMENVDPVGVHTGDSVVVAPSQTLTDRQYQMLRSVALKVIRALGVVGGCNIQFALDPHSDRYYLIEVNPRVSRSSALASKATGYPIARIAAKLALGYRLDEVRNPVTGHTYASFEPAVDYVVVKWPRWPFDKFPHADRTLGTQMKATGEVMAIDRTMEGAFLKAVRSLEIGVDHLALPEAAALSDAELEAEIRRGTDRRLFLIAEALRRGVDVETLHAWSAIDRFFLRALERIVAMERQLAACDWASVPAETLKEAKRLGFSDAYLARAFGVTLADVRARWKAWGWAPSYKLVDTCAAEFDAETPYYYATWCGVDEVEPLKKERKVLVIGSGPIRIGQGIEFDYCAVHAAKALKKMGVGAVVINNNPETVSTDFETADQLYFDPLTVEDVLNVAEKEGVDGVLVQFGGQTAINLAAKLEAHGLKVYGTPVEAIRRTEDREAFYALLRELDIPHIPGTGVMSEEEAVAAARRIGYPVLIRPSYVIGGRGMAVLADEGELMRYLAETRLAALDRSLFPLLIDRYVTGAEVEVDAVSDGETVIIPGIFRHVERAGVHSGDSYAVFPAPDLSASVTARLVDYTVRIARAIGAVGLLNIQFVVCGDDVYVLEVNPRASRTVPIVSKVTGVPMVALATQVQLGRTLPELSYPQTGLLESPGFYAVKAPVFSTVKLAGVDPAVGPEMQSTGEGIGLGTTVEEALWNALAWKEGGVRRLGAGDAVLVALADRDKAAFLPLAAKLAARGVKLVATPGTARFLHQDGWPVARAVDAREGAALLRDGAVTCALITPTRGRRPETDGFRLRTQALLAGVPLFTCVDTFAAYLEAMDTAVSPPRALAAYRGARAVVQGATNKEGMRP